MENTSDQTLNNNPPTDYSNWIPEPEAAKFLGINPRTLRDWAKKRPNEAPERKLCARPGLKAEPRYNPDDLKALRASLNPPRVLPVGNTPATPCPRARARN